MITTTLFVTRGIPGSGKTYWANEEADRIGAYHISRDDLRRDLFGRSDKCILTAEQEEQVTKVQRDIVSSELLTRHVIVDDMNLNPRYLQEWKDFASDLGAKFVVVEFRTIPDICVERDAERGENKVGERVIRKLAAKWGM